MALILKLATPSSLGTIDNDKSLALSSSTVKVLSKDPPTEIIWGFEKSPPWTSIWTEYSAAALKPKSGCVHVNVSISLAAFSSFKTRLSSESVKTVSAPSL